MTTINRRAFLKNTLAVSLSGSSIVSGTTAFAAQLPDDHLKAFLNSSKNSIAGIELRHKRRVAKVYTQRGFVPLWSEHGQYTNTSTAIVSRLKNASLLGLHPSSYYPQILTSWLHMQDPQTSTQVELVLTDSLFEFFDNLANGQTGKRPGDAESWFAKQAATDINTITDNFFGGSVSFRQTMNNLQPATAHYNKLLVALAGQKEILADGGYLKVSKGASLSAGMQDPRATQLRSRLWQSGDYTNTLSSNSDNFDPWLEDGLKSFQRRHGLEDDGVLGPNTLKALNTPVEDRIAQIEINLDRWRWLPQDLGDSHIIVNTAGFQMDVVLHGSTALHMNVVVGKPKHKTPVFSETMEHLVFNPTWNVPKSITRNELLPKELNNPGYLQSNNFVAISHSDKSTRSIDSFAQHELEPSSFISRYRLMQKAGKNNALGTVKFMLPNKHAIYLHDTNAKSLFQKTTRAYSHGCVRVADPVQLAKTLLVNEGHSEQSVEDRFATSATKTINLDNPLPIHMTYQTAWVDQHGALNFRNDIYGHDKYALRNYQRQRPSLEHTENQLLTLLDR